MQPSAQSTTHCPLCGQANQCRMAQPEPAPATELCWCQTVDIAPQVVANIPLSARNTACLCRRCACQER